MGPRNLMIKIFLLSNQIKNKKHPTGSILICACPIPDTGHYWYSHWIHWNRSVSGNSVLLAT